MLSQTYALVPLVYSMLVYSETPKHYAQLYKQHNITRCHVIKLGPNNDEAAKEALAGWPNGLQVGGGITSENAQTWLDYGASKVGGNSLSHIPPLCYVYHHEH